MVEGEAQSLCKGRIVSSCRDCCRDCYRDLPVWLEKGTSQSALVTGAVDDDDDG